MLRLSRWLSRFGWMSLSAASLVLLSTSAAFAQATVLRVVGFNVESGGANPVTLANQIGPIDGVDLWGFSEVDSELWTAAFETAAEVGEVNNPNFETILGTTGGRDRLAIIYNADRFELVETQELNDINPGGRVRSPLVAQLRDRATGEAFWFMVNHLYRGNDSARHQQAIQLNDWAEQQSLPVIAAGDFNFDWDVPSNGAQRDQGFDNLVADGVFAWVEPSNILKTHCSTRYNSILDFVFVANQPQTWQATSEVLFPESSYCPDDTTTSDHRPVMATIQLAAVPDGDLPDDDTTDDDIKTQLLERIQRLEQELEELQQLIEQQL